MYCNLDTDAAYLDTRSVLDTASGQGSPQLDHNRADVMDMHRSKVNKLGPLHFVVAFGIVSMLADFVYEGARSIVGPFLATFGASAVLVGFVTGFGEAVALVFRLFTGRLSDRTGRHWLLSITGYAITVVAVPLLAISGALWQAAVLVVAERFGKAVRTPARDTMLAQAARDHGRGFVFALHEALDQSGAMLGPLLVAGMVAISGYRLGFAVLLIPGILAIATIAWLRKAVPTPALYELRPAVNGTRESREARNSRFPATFWMYAAFTAISMLGFATFGVLSYHLQVKHVLSAPLIPVVYAVAMGAAALAALVSGRSYDRVGLRGLFAVPLLTAVVPFLSFSTTPALVWIGATLWGAATGVHESTMRAAVAGIVSKEQRGSGFGTFTAVYGLAWLVGATVMGALYAHSIPSIGYYVVATQALAILVLIRLIRIA